MYFKVKVDKTDASWASEKYEVDWVLQADTVNGNSVYVKAVLSTTDNTKTPIIDYFRVRVV